MKIIVILAIGIVVAFIIITGCETTKDRRNITSSPTFEPFHLRQGQLTVYVGGSTGEFSVSIDNVSVGVATTNRPLTLMEDVGNRRVEVCCGTTCVYQNIDVRFGKPRTIDFSVQLEKECKFLEPTVRVVNYFFNGDQITVVVEFINPTTKNLTMSAEISCVYTYIESRGNNRVANSAEDWAFSTLKPGERVTQTLNLVLANGSSYIYGVPTINQVLIK